MRTKAKSISTNQRSGEKFLLVDDHQMVRQSIQHFLKISWPKAMFHEAGSGMEAIEAVVREPWDIVILDINMPGRDGIDVIKAIKKARPATPVLILTMHPESLFGVRALKAGASGYVTKGSDLEELSKAVQVIFGGGYYISPQLGQSCGIQLASAMHKTRDQTFSLSDREFEIVRWLALGRSAKEIASELVLSFKTVHVYRARVMKKLGLQNTADIVRWAYQNKLVE